jgi:hypothetical protein
LDQNLPAAEPESEWATKRADQLHLGDRIAGDMLPLGQPGEVIFTRFFERNGSEWMYVAFVQWDGFHDSTTFLASAPVRVRTAEPKRVEDPTGLTYTRADDEPEGVQVFMSGMTGPASEVVLTRPRRVEPHTGAMTDEGLVDETPLLHYPAGEGYSICGLHVTALPEGSFTKDYARVSCRPCADGMPS